MSNTCISFRKIGILLLAALILHMMTACGKKSGQDKQQTSVTPTGPEASCEQTSYSFGKVERGDDVSHVFIIKNTGNAPLELLGTHSFCPCLMPHLNGTNIAPGAVGKLTLHLNTTRQQGQIKHKVTLNTNDLNHSKITFQLSGEVKVLAAFEPDVLSFGSILKGSTKSAQLDLIGAKRKEMKPGEILSSNPERIKAELFGKGDELAVKVTVKAPEQEGRLAGIIRLPTGLDKPKEIRARILARVTSDLVTDRTYAVFSTKKPEGDQNAIKTQDQPVYLVHVRSLTNKPFKITGVRDPSGLISGQAKPTKGGWVVELRLSRQPSKKRGDIYLDTDQKDQPVLSVKYIIRSGQSPKKSIRPRLRTRTDMQKPLMRVDPRHVPGSKHKGQIKLNHEVRHQPGKIRRFSPNKPKRYPPPSAKPILKSGAKSK